MLGATRLIKDTAGGMIFYTNNRTVVVNFFPAVCNDGLVAPHDPYPDHLHVQTFTDWSHSIFASGLPVVRENDPATCGHVATGSKSVFFN